MTNPHTAALLRAHLQAAVPLAIDDYLRGHRPWPDPDQIAQVIAAHGDSILHRTAHTAAAVTALTQGVACLAFCPGGVVLLGDHYQVPEAQARAFFGPAYANRTAHLIQQRTLFETLFRRHSHDNR
jgi:hypothetical protein